MEIISARRKNYLHIKSLRVGHDSWWLQHWKSCTFLVNKLRTKVVSNHTHASVIAAKISSDLSVLDIVVVWSMPTTYAYESFIKILRIKIEALFPLWEMLETDYGEEKSCVVFFKLNVCKSQITFFFFILNGNLQRPTRWIYFQGERLTLVTS